MGLFLYIIRMNFLSHFILGADKDEHIVGNFLGDFVKGKDHNNYRKDIQDGIIMHRMIDSYVDNHESFLKSKRMVFHRYRHYAGVVVDVYYDYFLAKNWQQFSDENLEVFISKCYTTLSNYQEEMPFSAQVGFKHMKQGDWLTRYTNLEGVARTFLGLSKYIKRKTGIETAVEELIIHEDIFNQHFLEFFPEMVKERDRFIEAL